MDKQNNNTEPPPLSKHHDSRVVYDMYFDLLVSASTGAGSGSCNSQLEENKNDEPKVTMTLITDDAKLHSKNTTCNTAVSSSTSSFHRAANHKRVARGRQTKRNSKAKPKKRDVSPPICRWQSDRPKSNSNNINSNDNIDNKEYDNAEESTQQKENLRKGLPANSSRNNNSSSRPACPQRKQSNDFMDLTTTAIMDNSTSRRPPRRKRDDDALLSSSDHTNYYSNSSSRSRFHPFCFKRSLSVNDINTNTSTRDRPLCPQRKASGDKMEDVVESLKKANNDADNVDSGAKRNVRQSSNKCLLRTKPSKSFDGGVNSRTTNQKTTTEEDLLQHEQMQQQKEHRTLPRMSRSYEEHSEPQWHINDPRKVSAATTATYNEKGIKRRKERRYCHHLTLDGEVARAA